MRHAKRTLDELNIMDDFLMNAVASDQQVGEEFCRLVLSTLLQMEIGPVKVVAQKMIPALTPNLRGIRLDVEVTEQVDQKGQEQRICRVYDLEPKMYKEKYLPRRNRFYQAKIDSCYLKSGKKDFAELPDLYVILITPYDPFGYGYMMYTVKNYCKEVPDLLYEDGLRYIYFNTCGTKGGNEAIRALLKYMQNSSEENATTDELRKIHCCVNKVKVLPEVREKLMTVGEYIDYYQDLAAKERWVNCVLELLEDYGKPSEELTEQLKRQSDEICMSRILKLAAKSDSISAFEQEIQKLPGILS